MGVVASMATFLASGVLHEMIVYLLLDYPTTYEQVSFFLLHGVLCIGQVTLEKMGITVRNRFAGQIVTTIVFLWTSPLFVNPFERESIIEALCRGWTIVQ